MMDLLENVELPPDDEYQAALQRAEETKAALADLNARAQEQGKAADAAQAALAKLTAQHAKLVLADSSPSADKALLACNRAIDEQNHSYRMATERQGALLEGEHRLELIQLAEIASKDLQRVHAQYWGAYRRAVEQSDAFTAVRKLFQQLTAVASAESPYTSFNKVQYWLETDRGMAPLRGDRATSVPGPVPLASPPALALSAQDRQFRDRVEAPGASTPTSEVPLEVVTPQPNPAYTPPRKSAVVSPRRHINV